MQESRMIAEVAPPGVCAMLKVSGSRMATPLAPPSPGSTPMITPRITPVNISSRLVSVSATAKPPARAWTSATSVQPEESFDGTLGQRHQEPALEDQEQRHRGAGADGDHFPPRELAQPAHEEGDEQDRGDVDADPADRRGVDRGGNQHRQHHLQLPREDERRVLVRGDHEAARQVHHRRDRHDQPDIERKVARLGAVVTPGRAQAHAVVHHQDARHEKERRDRDLGALDAEGDSPFALLGHLPAMMPAAFISEMWRASSFATQSAYSLPVSAVLLKAPSSMSLVHSGVAMTFLKRST